MVKEVKEVNEEKGKNECTKNICKKQIFTLIIKIKFENGAERETLKTQFKSKSSQGGCNLPNEKNFKKAYKKAYKKLVDKWRSSHQPGNKIANISTQIIHNINSSSISNSDTSYWTSTWKDSWTSY